MMRYTKMVLSALCLVVTGWLGTAEAFDAFLFIPGFQGEAADVQHKNWIILHEVSWGHTNTGTANFGGGGGLGRAQFQDVLVQKLLDSASLALATAVATGQHFPNAIIEIVKPAENRRTFARLELTDVSITAYAYEAKAAAGGQTLDPVESIKLNFSKIVWIYIPQNQAGKAGAPIRGGWDLNANTKL